MCVVWLRAVLQGMDWLVEKVKAPIQRDADFYYHRAAEQRFLGSAGTPTFKDAEDDLVKAVDVARLNQHRAMQTGRQHVRHPTTSIATMHTRSTALVATALALRSHMCVYAPPMIVRNRTTGLTVSCRKSYSERRMPDDRAWSRDARDGMWAIQLYAGGTMQV